MMKGRMSVPDQPAHQASKQAADQPALAALLTEARNPATEHLDQFSTLAMLEIINGGRLFYIGAGTSGRLGVLDASECPPTFSVSADLVQGLIAGGDRALRLSSEHSEDSPVEGARDLASASFTQQDTLVGIAASGRTPYVLGALAHAKELGALTIGLTCVPASAISQAADIAITPATGPEVLTGSTRLKAGTATKLVLNMLSTGVMVRTGATLGNLMVNVRPTNAKLIDRAHRIIAAATGCAMERAAELLAASGNSVKTAIAMQKLGLTRQAAEDRLAASDGVLAAALKGA